MATKAGGGKPTDLTELVEIRIPRRPVGTGEQDMFVFVKKPTKIKRGEVVKVPYYVALVIEQSLRADEATAMKIEEMQALAKSSV